MKTLRTIPVLVPLAIAFTLSPGASSAAIAQETTVEIFGGSYMSGIDGLPDDTSYGLRGGYRISDSYGVEGSLSLFRPDVGIGLEEDYLLLDVSHKWYIGSAGNYDFVLFGGTGWIVVKTSGLGASTTDSSYSGHLGVAGEFHLGERIYLRPDVRARWIERSQEVDIEATLGLGFQF